MNHLRLIVSLLLASLMLIASLGMTVSVHLCAGQVQSIAFFGNAKPCKDEKKLCHSSVYRSKKNGCCEEKSIVLKGKETNAEVKIAALINPSFNLIAVIFPSLHSVIKANSSVATTYCAHYKPPSVERDITLFVQSFLI